MAADTFEARTAAIVAEFADLEPRERLELLLDFANNLPPLPPHLEEQRLAGEHRVHECQTPVFLWTELADNRILVHAWVAPEAPTVKGFVGIACELYRGLAPDALLKIETNLLQQLGLAETLGMMRSRGLSAVLFHLQKNVQSLIDSAASSTK